MPSGTQSERSRGGQPDGVPGGDGVDGTDVDGTKGGGADRDPERWGVVGCRAGHRFDVARHGYLPLLGPRARTDTGDDARMVAARAEFLAGGWYAPIALTVAAAASAGARVRADAAPVDGGLPRSAGSADAPGAVGGPVVEVGAGTGYYLAAVCGALPPADARASSDPEDGAKAAVSPPVHVVRGVAIDSSRYALRRAARAAGVAAVLADAWSPLPVRDGIASAVLSVFAPRDPAELVRITADGGRIVVVSPEPDHLAELRGPLPLLAVDAGKAGRVVEMFAARPVALLDARTLRYTAELPTDAVANLVAMGPTARHLDDRALARAVRALAQPVTVTVSVTVTTLQRNGSAGL